MNSSVDNYMRTSFDARSVNEGLARMIVAAFMSEMNPTLTELDDVKTAVSEAVTNAIIHGYEVDIAGEAYGQILGKVSEAAERGAAERGNSDGAAERPRDADCLANKLGRVAVIDEKNEGHEAQVQITCERCGRKLTIIVEDFGVGIEDIARAREPFYTSKPDLERSGMGFSFMEAFMDGMEVASEPGKGTRITMWKFLLEGNDR